VIYKLKENTKRRRQNGGGDGGACPCNVETTGASIFSPLQYFPRFLHAVR